MPRLSLCTLLAAAATLSHAHAHDLAPELAPRLDLEVGQQGETAAGHFGLMLPFNIAPGVIGYGDIRGSVSTEGTLGGSLGLGARADVGDWLLGGYAYLDMGEGLFGTDFQQISAGIEALGEFWEFRVNGYLPVGDTEAAVDGLTTVGVDGGGFAIRQGYEVALHGIEAEAGVTLPVFDADDDKTLKLLANAFVFDSDRTETLAGFGARAEFSFAAFEDWLPGSRLTLGAGAKHDNQDGLSGGVFARLSVPVNGDDLLPRVERRDTITTDAGAFGDVEAGMLGGAVARVASVDGTTPDLAGAILLAGEGAVILASGDIFVDQTLLLVAGQTLLGGGGTIDLTASGSGKTVAFTNTGAATTLAAGGNSFARVAPVDVIHMAEGSTVAALTIEGGENAILADGVGDVTIRDVTINGPAANGIKLHNVNGATIAGVAINDIVCNAPNRSDCTFTQADDPSYLRHAGINAVAVKDLDISYVWMDQVDHGLLVASEWDTDEWEYLEGGRASNLTVDNLHIRQTAGEGILTFGLDGFTARDISIVNEGPEWDLDMLALLNTNDVDIDGAHLSGGVNGLMVIQNLYFANERPMNGTFSNFTIENMSRTGVFLNNASGMSFRNFAIDDVAKHGIVFNSDFYGDVSDLSFENFEIGAVGPFPGESEWEKAGAININDVAYDLDGDITYTGAARDCAAFVQWGAGIEQSGSNTLTFNGAEVTADWLEAHCE